MKRIKVFGRWELTYLSDFITDYQNKGYELKEIGDIFYIFEETKHTDRKYHVFSGEIPEGWEQVKGSNEKIAVLYSDNDVSPPPLISKEQYRKGARQNLINAGLIICAFIYIFVMLFSVEDSFPELISDLGYCTSISAVTAAGLLLFLFLRGYYDAKLILNNTYVKGSWKKRFRINLAVRIILIIAITIFTCNWFLLLAGLDPWI